MPLVSVLIPAYHAETTLARAVASVHAQTLSDWEVIIAVDDDFDYTRLLAEAGLLDRVAIFASGSYGSGAGKPRTTAALKAQGTYLAPLDADDVFDSRRLELLVSQAAKYGAATDNTAVCNHSGQAQRLALPQAQSPFDLRAIELLEPRVPFFPVFRRELLGEGWSEVAFADDVLFNLELLGRVAGYRLEPRPLYRYHKTPGSLTHSPDSGERAKLGYQQILTQLRQGSFELDVETRRMALSVFEQDLARNSLFRQWLEAGRCRNLEEFLVCLQNRSVAE